MIVEREAAMGRPIAHPLRLLSPHPFSRLSKNTSFLLAQGCHVVRINFCQEFRWRFIDLLRARRAADEYKLSVDDGRLCVSR